MTRALFQEPTTKTITAIQAFLKSCGADIERPYDNANINLHAFHTSTTPAGLFKTVDAPLSLLVLGCGACAILENNTLEEDRGEVVRILEHPEPLTLMRQASELGRDGTSCADDLTITPTTSLQSFRFLPWGQPRFIPIALSQGARDLPFTPSDTPVEVCADQVFEALREWSLDLDDPFVFEMEDSKGWDDVQAASFVDVITDTLLALDYEGTVVVYANNTQDATGIQLTSEEDGDPIDEEQRILWLVCNSVDTDAFHGYSWEYNDGATTRTSGFYPSALSIASITCDDASHHTRIAARKRTQDRLAAIDGGQHTTAFFDTTQPFLED